MRKRGFEIVRDECRVFPNVDVKLPIRGSKNSMACDFFSNEDVVIKPGEKYSFATDIKAYMQERECLVGTVRSNQGIKRNLSFANSQAWIDMDFYENITNDGNITICLYNYGKEDEVIKKGDRIAQFAFMPFLEPDNCHTENERVGGIGSTGR